MKTMNIVCFGFGQVAKNFIKRLNEQGVPFKLTKTSRENSNMSKGMLDSARISYANKLLFSLYLVSIPFTYIFTSSTWSLRELAYSRSINVLSSR